MKDEKMREKLEAHLSCSNANVKKPSQQLTKRQAEILEYVPSHIDDMGYPPTIGEIGKAFAIASPRGARSCLEALERKGIIVRSATSRSVNVVGKPGSTSPLRNVSFVPLVGTIPAGTPITATQNIEASIPVPTEMVKDSKGAFALQAKGDSMTGTHVQTNDVVFIQPQSNADNDDLAAVLIGDEATVKRIQFAGDIARLLPANPSYQPIAVAREHCRIIGKVIGLIRKYEG